MVPAGRRTIPELAVAAAERFTDDSAVADGVHRLTYAQLLDQSCAFGAALVASGIAVGDRVSIWAPNGAEWIVAALGLWHAGAVLVPVNTRFKGGEAIDVLARARVRALVTMSGFLGNDYVGMLRTTGVDLADLETIVVVGPEAAAGTRPWADFVISGSAADRAECDRRRGEIGADTASDILFTSGTTGSPKGVVSTHRRTLFVATDWVDMVGLGRGDRYLQVNPYFHMFGLKAGILASVAAGATMLPEPVLDVERVLRRVQEERVTVLPGSPTLYQSILDHPGRDDFELSSLRAGTIGAADIPVELVRRIFAELPYSVMIAGYGLTEGGTVAATAPGDDAETIAATVGRPRPGFELRLVDAEGAPVASGEPGEITVRGPSVMLHYLDDREATAAALSGEGWLRTGDLARWTEGGCLQIVGRVKDMFIVGGFNAYPAEIENALLRHPAVQQVAVIGIPDVRLGEVGMAFVVRTPGSTDTPEDLIRWAREQMANYKVPRVVEFVDGLPLNATGKVAKDQLRRLAD